MINQEKKVSRAAPHFERESSSPLKSPVSKPPTEGVKHDDEILSNNVKNEVIAFLFFFFCFNCCCCSVAKACPTLCNPMDCSTPGFPVPHYLPEFAQTHVH